MPGPDNDAMAAIESWQEAPDAPGTYAEPQIMNRTVNLTDVFMICGLFGGDPYPPYRGPSA